MLTRICVAGYRSVRNLPLEIGRVTVFVGANGSGKSNLYRGLKLFSEAAAGRLSRALADEGGLRSALSANESPVPCTELRLSCTVDAWSYEIAIGLPPVGRSTAFGLDPHVHSERLTACVDGRNVVFVERHNVRTKVRDREGRFVDFPHDLLSGEAALGQIHDPDRFPELASLRERLHGWRFYHQFRTDEASPLRRPQIGVFTPILAHDGVDLAAALQSIREHGLGVGGSSLDEWLDRALPGARLLVANDASASFEVLLALPKIQRPLRAAEMSDGQLRLLCLLAALSSPRPPELVVFNEPETSLHPDVLPVLADLVVAASRHTQIVLTTHDQAFAQRIAASAGEEPRVLELRNGETRLAGRGRYE
ncbi:MAG: AAA family ATPase [Planctomycetes bacterium]|nr:AAA family ATPase [Planctomycetota bacterium]